MIDNKNKIKKFDEKGREIIEENVKFFIDSTIQTIQEDGI